jgi:hypothetical protein
LLFDWLESLVVQGSSAAELACFAGIDESDYGSMEALDKQVWDLISRI